MGKTYKDQRNFSKKHGKKPSYEEDFEEPKSKYKKGKKPIDLEIEEEFEEEVIVIVSNEKEE